MYAVFKDRIGLKYHCSIHLRDVLLFKYLCKKRKKNVLFSLAVEIY